ncbi:MAG: FIST N-terminal domain-containing protein [Phycisphaerales bacterium]
MTDADQSESRPASAHQEVLTIACGVSTIPDPVDAAKQACDQISVSAQGSIDLVIGFVTPKFGQRVGMIADAIRSYLGPKHILLVSAQGIMGNDLEIDDEAGVSLMAARLPGVEMHPYFLDASWGAQDPAERVAKISDLIGVNEQMAASFFFADPFSVPLVNLVPALSDARIQYADAHGHTKRIGTVIGGMASAAQNPGNNTLFLDGEIRNYGAIGITLSGNLQVDTIVSQGCRPVGEPMVITRAKGNLILELGGKPAIEAIRESLQSLTNDDQDLLENGLLMGRVINEQQSRFGRGDFLIRNIMGGDEQSGAIAIADLIQAGQTIQPHLHDEQTAREDLSLMLDAQRLYDRPAGALVVSCTGRTHEFFGDRGHDAQAIRHAFDPPVDGPTLAKAGRELNAPDRGIPLAGFFGAGEIGPVGDSIFQHGHTTVAALFREPEKLDI